MKQNIAPLHDSWRGAVRLWIDYNRSVVSCAPGSCGAVLIARRGHSQGLQRIEKDLGGIEDVVNIGAVSSFVQEREVKCGRQGV